VTVTLALPVFGDALGDLPRLLGVVSVDLVFFAPGEVRLTIQDCWGSIFFHSDSYPDLNLPELISPMQYGHGVVSVDLVFFAR
jgi:hypothetical protein